ncbi:MAG TPA: hypothetical protein DCQ50_21165 [Chryseobacterium sp.]|nr:hypothetical protein [Chryseobacterium sp.]
MKLQFNRILGNKAGELAKIIIDKFNLKYSETGREMNVLKEAEVFYEDHKDQIRQADFNDVLSHFIATNIHSEGIPPADFPKAYRLLNFFTDYICYLSDFSLTNDKIIFRGVSRMVAPPKEAYKYLGHNKMDIFDSKKGYALLSEE